MFYHGTFQNLHCSALRTFWHMDVSTWEGFEMATFWHGEFSGRGIFGIFPSRACFNTETFRHRDFSAWGIFDTVNFWHETFWHKGFFDTWNFWHREFSAWRHFGTGIFGVGIFMARILGTLTFLTPFLGPVDINKNLMQWMFCYFSKIDIPWT